jgi:hypothetical protein
VGVKRESEETFLRLVVQYARLMRWLVYHTHDARASESGFPDLVFVRGETIIYAELKSRTGKRTAEQELWASALGAAGQVVHLWRPGDWNEIQLLLA